MDDGGLDARSVPEADLRRQVAVHIDACRARIPGFVEVNFAWPGAWRLSRRAWGTDILVAPFNFLMGFPNFLLRLLALLAGVVGAGEASRRLACAHLGLPTVVQRVLTARLMGDLLDVADPPGGARDAVRAHLAAAAREAVQIYVQTRNVAADITAGTLAAVLGLTLLHQFTPGSISVGSALARIAAREQAVSEFLLGEGLGRVYYALFPVNPSLGILAAVLLLVMALVAVVAAFAGIVHDPIQTWTGTHRRRLERLLDAIQAAADDPAGPGYRPRDTFVGRVYDLIDWIKGVFPG